MQKVIFPIDVELVYESEEEKNEKLEVINTLLLEITKSKDRFSDIKKLNKFLSIIKWNKQPKSFYITQISISVFFVSIVSIVLLGITYFRSDIVSTIYLWWNKWYWYFLVDNKLEYWEFNVKWCSNIACETNKWIVLKRYIDYYSIF